MSAPHIISSGSGTVWIVDDSLLARTHAHRLLAGLHAVTMFEDGEQLLERLSEPDANPDLLVVDWVLPGMSGLDLCRFVRRTTDEISLPILVCTAFADDLGEALHAGANDFLRKPFVDAELVSRVRTLVRVRQLAVRLGDRDRHRLRQSRAAAAVGDALTRRLDETTALQGCADALVLHLDLLGARVWTRRADGELTPVASAGVMPPVGAPLADARRNVVATRQPVRATVDGLPRPAARAAGAVEPLAYVGQPFLLGDHVTGIVEALSRDHVADDVLDTLRHAADLMALGMERLRSTAALRQRADFEQQLIGIVSHDLRAPIGAVLMGAELLASREDASGAFQDGIARIRRSAARAGRMIRDLLDFTQARLGGGIATSMKTVALTDIAKQSLEEFRLSHPDRRFDLDVQGDGDALADADRVSQLLGNLLSNALHYSPAETAVRVFIRRDGDGVVLGVNNGGQPIPADVKARLFEPFQRGAAADHSQRSVGLGHFIVKQIVDAHEGAIEVTSTALDGTTVEVRFPAVPRTSIA